MGKKLEVLKKALEAGADIQINYSSVKHQFTKSQAEEVVKELSHDLGIEYKENDSYSWFEDRYKFDNQFSFVVHYEDTKEEKIHQLEKQLKKLKEESA